MCDHAAGDWAAVLRRRPLRLVEGRPQGGHAAGFEIICCVCGDSPYLDYRGPAGAVADPRALPVPGARHRL